MTDSGPSKPHALPKQLQLFGEYVIDSLIDEGPTWALYKAVHIANENQRFRVRLLHGVDATRRQVIEAFARMAILLQSLNHPGIIPVCAAGVDQGLVFVINAEVPGITLKQRMEGGLSALDPHETARIVRETASVLDYLHNHNPPIVHRTLDPSKILLSQPGGAVKILEVGYAHAVEEVARVEPIPFTPNSPPGFRAPEDLPGTPARPALDEYALAKIAHACLTMRKTPANEAALAATAALFARAMSVEPDARFPSAGAFAEAFTEAMATVKPRQSPSGSGLALGAVGTAPPRPAGIPSRPIPVPTRPASMGMGPASSGLSRKATILNTPGLGAGGSKPRIASAEGRPGGPKPDSTGSYGAQATAPGSITAGATTAAMDAAPPAAPDASLAEPEKAPSSTAIASPGPAAIASAAATASPGPAAIADAAASTSPGPAAVESAAMESAATPAERIEGGIEPAAEAEHGDDFVPHAISLVSIDGLDVIPIDRPSDAAIPTPASTASASSATSTAPLFGGPPAPTAPAAESDTAKPPSRPPPLPVATVSAPAAGPDEWSQVVRPKPLPGEVVSAPAPTPAPMVSPPSDRPAASRVAPHDEIAFVPAPTAAPKGSNAVRIATILGVSFVLGSLIITAGVILREPLMQLAQGRSAQPAATPADHPVIHVAPPTAVDASVAIANAPDAGAQVVANSAIDASVAIVPAAVHDAGAPVAVETHDAGATIAVATQDAGVAPPTTDTSLPRRPTREMQDTAQAAIERRIATCEGHLGHHAYIRVVYDGPTGQPSAVEFTGHTLDGNPLAPCVEAAVRAVNVPAFRDAHWEAHYTVMIR